MGRNGFSAALLLLLVFIVVDVSKASMVSKHRYLIGEPPKDNTTSKPPGKDSPAPSVVPPLSSSSNNGSDPNDATNNKTGSGSAKTPKSDQVGGSNNDTDKGFVSPSIEIGDGKNQTKKQKKELNPVPAPAPEKKPKENPAPVAEKKKPKEEAEKKPKEEAVLASPPPPPKDVKPKSLDDDNVDNAKNVKKESCEGATKKCGDVVACIKSFDKESKEAVILVENIGNSPLKGNVSAENTKGLNISKLQNKKVKLKMGESNEILIKVGTVKCVLRMDPPVSEGNVFMRLPSYEKVLTPINGAYFLIVAVLIFGVTCACCMVKKRKQRTGGGVPYQELEMALPESISATEVVTADGWDEGWDDDWDGDNAVKSPGGHLVGSISANGLTARSSNKDGWENNWDD